MKLGALGNSLSCNEILLLSCIGGGVHAFTDSFCLEFLAIRITIRNTIKTPRITIRVSTEIRGALSEAALSVINVYKAEAKGRSRSYI